VNARRRWWIGVAALAVVAVVAFALARFARPTVAVSSNVAAPDVALVTVRYGAVADRIEAEGRVGPPAGNSARLAFAQAGIVQAVLVHVGDSVVAGRPVAQLDRSSLAVAVDAARADVLASGTAAGASANAAESSASARLAVAQAKLRALLAGGPGATSGEIAAASTARQAALKVDADAAAVTRAEALFAAGVVASRDVDAARAQLAADAADRRAADAHVASASADFAASLEQARADVASARNDVLTAGGQAASAQARLAAAQIAYANGVLAAPADGVVLAILKHPGEAVDPSQPVVEIGPPLGHSVTLTVPADASRRIHVGDPAVLALTATGETATHGSVVAVVPAVDPATQVGTVVVSGAPADAFPGEAVRARITVGSTPGIVVPASAIVQDPQTGATVVFVRDAHADGGRPGYRMRPVVVRTNDGAHAAIAGIRAGERVAAQGAYALLAPAGG
jgi:multidrug efflux pump subunit AcrA (membrane-fusion protein)